ncbi:conserved hypothetical protein [Nitrospina gracilis 3/211]|uniref:Uncharacterized protein n=1 Tax=Nitrospina gracilis (strain 3/211) TaxID=1266370 RepID=M1ZC40_NITG3|nr:MULTISPECIES: hypothetical protein [Nitrospina]MCF8723743.1 hypothetical protein [Nitrospina sp. Nb-3]CCQ90843.1 conserved hypothetical protein [Nitrospina gracilis 3/211]
MAEFQKTQQDLTGIRKTRDSKQKDVFHTREKLKKLEQEKQDVLRTAGTNSNAYQSLLGREEELNQVLSSHESSLAGLLTQEKEFWKNFEPFTDPRSQLKNLSDEYPVLLFPVRLEVRFKNIQSASEGTQHQLWVRIFPDECSIDTFDDTLSETELNKAQSYWINLWMAGTAGNDAVQPFVMDKKRGAWRELMGVFNAGRAYWIKENYLPVNAADIPQRNSDGERILIISTEDLPDETTRAALQNYWSAVFLANGDATQVADALTTLATTLAITEEAALQLTPTYRPQNLEPGLNPENPMPDVQVAFLVFPKQEETDSKINAWSRAAQVTTLPERFVLMGYQKGVEEPVVQELGGLVRDPLIVGPDPSLDLNEVLKAVYGEDFDTLTEDEKAEKYIEYLSTQSETKWLFDFEEALLAGMGFKIDISKEVHDQGFERLFVLGVKISADETEGKTLLETLIHNHHYGDSGFSLVPQGTPTNNTGEGKSGYTETEDADAAYRRYFFETPPEDPQDETVKHDGRWLAEFLGIDAGTSTLSLAEGYYGKDQSEARAMNTALWNATLGYFMESMLTPVFNDNQRNLARWFLINHVSGRGRLPAIRIGDQPYGILPISNIPQIAWATHDGAVAAHSHFAWNHLAPLNPIKNVLFKIREDWESLLNEVAYIGKEGGDSDAHEILLKVLGLHATSVEFDQRYAESFEHLFNRLKLEGLGGLIEAVAIKAGYKPVGMGLLTSLGYVHDQKLDPTIPILEKYFLTKELDVHKPLIDDRELSEVEPIRAYTDSGQNYIEWLIENALNNHKNIRQQKGFTDNKKPFALLYDMLRHAVNLAFGNTGLNLYKNAEIITDAQLSAAKVDSNFIGIQAQPQTLESKWDPLYRSDDRIAADGVMLVDHISNLLKTHVINSQTEHLHETISALELLKDTPTARLERAFVEHLDACTYRLDAWLLGLVNAQLHAMRFGASGSSDDSPKQGVLIGAYGWLENLKPDNKALAPAQLSNEMKAIFDPAGDKDPRTDNTNAGYVHAPSINHGITAAVLRNAYLSNASQENAEPFKVNLSSERVRLALSIVEGLQQGQSLAALLGYQLERGLHDNNELELDVYIYELRKMFPLVSNKMIPTQIKKDKTGDTPEELQRIQEEEQEFEQDKAVTKIEARNVVNGLALLDHVSQPGKESYPFGFPIGDGVGKMKSAPGPVAAAINAEIERLKNIRDAVADLAMAESVHQVVQGNYDRAAGSLDAYSKGGYPQLPDVIQSPGSGTGLTHRFGIHLPATATAGPAGTPRALAEPAVNQWLQAVFPVDLSKIACRAQYKLPDYEKTDAHPTTTKTVSMADLGLLPIDLLYMLSVESDKSLTSLDDHILKFLHATETPRPDVEVEIQYSHVFDAADDIVTFFELAPLVESLRSLVVRSRPLRPSDIALQNEAEKKQDAASSIDRTLLVDARQGVVDLTASLQTNVVVEFSGLIVDDDFEATLGNATQILAKIDSVLAHYIDVQYQLGRYGIPQAGFGFIYERKRKLYSAIIKKVLNYKNAMLAKQAEYDDLIGIQLPAATTDEERFTLMKKAEKLISTQSTVPRPSTVGDYKTILDGKKTAYDAKASSFQTFLSGSFANLLDFTTQLAGLKTGLEAFEFTLLDTDDEERQVIVFAEDVYNQAGKTVTALTQITDSVQSLLDKEAASANAVENIKILSEAAKKIFGEDFKILPRFTLTGSQATELQNCIAAQSQLLDYQTTVKDNDFPVDEWLYGVARVREKMSAWENTVLLSEGFNDGVSLELTPFQLPYTENDPWLALEYPPEYVIDNDKLLYTAHAPGFDGSQPQCGLLVDEWTEVIPARQETTGLTFHYDRPNSEPPQTLLLATPPSFSGEWKWNDLVATLHEALNLAKLRAIEPDHVDTTTYAQFLPATVAAVTMFPVTMALNYALQADIHLNLSDEDNG